MSNSLPLASVSLDADNLWSYMKTHGDAGWEKRPNYLPAFIPIVLDALDRLDLRITFFVVGLDASRDENRSSLAGIVSRGHEVGNHSFEHEPWLHRYSELQLEDELAKTEEALVNACGQRPLGFRGPGFSWSPLLLEILERRGYLYDASTLPTYLGPVARAYYFWTARLTPEERRDRESLFGTFRDGFRPVRPYNWSMPNGRNLLEIPVTTIPVIKTPFHLSYLLYLARFSEKLMVAYLRSALAMCRMTGTAPSFLLHPLDILGGDMVPELRFFPGMDIPTEKKIRLFETVHRILAGQYSLVPMSTHARELLAGQRLRSRVPLLAPG